MTELIIRDVAPTPATQSRMELLSDVRTALASVARDLIPSAHQVTLQARPPAVVLRIPGATNEATEAALHLLAGEMKAVAEATMPQLPLRFVVIGGSEAAGIEITPIEAPAEEAAYPYFHVIHRADLRHLRRTDYMKGHAP